MPVNVTVDAVFILRRLQEEYLDKGKKLYTCVVDNDKGFDYLPKNVLEWAMKNKVIV